MLIPDQFDLWLVDPSGKKASRNLTKIGREPNTQFKFVNQSRTEGKSGGRYDPADDVPVVQPRQQGERFSIRCVPGQAIQKLVEGPYNLCDCGFCP